MNMWLSSHFLVAGLFLSSSALTPEECRPLLTPLSLADPSFTYGRSNFIVGYTDNEIFNAILKITNSCWMNITASPSDPHTVVMSQENRMNGTCVASVANVTIAGNTASTSVAGVTSDFHLLPSCNGCILFNIKSTARNIDKLLHKMNIHTNTTAEEVHTHALYLMARETTLNDSDMEYFKQQARCLGFAGEPNFLYDPKNEFCAEGEGIKLY